MHRPGLRWLLVAGAASPAFLALWTIRRYGVDLPVLDQWAPDIAGAVIKAQQGRLALADVVAQHNEHRMVVPRLLMIVLALASRWNTVWEMVAAWAIAGVTSAGILWLGVRTAGSRLDGATLAKWFLCNLLIFSPAQWENWLWGVGIANVLPPACLVVGAAVLGSSWRPALRVGCAALLATAATFSIATGVLAWPTLGALLWRKRLHRIAWIAAFLANVALYAWHYVEPPHPVGVDAYFAGVPRIAHYALVFLGNAFASASPLHPAAISAVAGGLMLAMLAIAGVRFSGRMPVWIALAGFAVLGALTVALFRAGFGPEQAAASRYASVSILLPIALVHLVPLAGAGVRLTAFLGAALGLLQACTVPASLDACVDVAVSRRQGKAQLSLIDVLPADRLAIQDLSFDPPTMIAEARALNALGCLRPPLIASDRIALLQGSAIVPGRLESTLRSRTGQIRAAGWALPPRGKATVDAVLLTCDDARGEPVLVAVAHVGAKRADLAAARQDTSYLWSGWVADLPVVPQPAAVRAWVLDADTGKVSKLD